MSLRAAFESMTPNITSSERTQNIKAKNIYTNMQELVRYGSGSTGAFSTPTYDSPPICSGAGSNYTGTLRFNNKGYVTNYRSYELANSMARGAAFNWDNCCRGISIEGGSIGDFISYAPVGLETWNINGGRIETYEHGMQYWGGVNIPPTNWSGWIEGKLNNAGATGPTYGMTAVSTLNGNGVWIDPKNTLFGAINDCQIDKWKKLAYVAGDYRHISSNNTKKNYMTAYQTIGRRFSIESWNLRFQPIYYGYLGRSLGFTGTTGATGGCCNPNGVIWTT